MFCPKCAAEINSGETKFCSKCGLKIKSAISIFESDKSGGDEISPFQKGLRFGVKLLLLVLILIPIFQIFGGFFIPDDKLVESSPSSSWFDFLGNAVLLTLTFAGVARILYAIVFERAAKSSAAEADAVKEISAQKINALPPSQATPASNFSKWKEATGDLFEPVFSKRKTSGELK